MGYLRRSFSNNIYMKNSGGLLTEQYWSIDLSLT